MSNHRLHALIVEDHAASALSVKAALSMMGFATFGFASSAAQAVTAAKTRRPDLVLASLALKSDPGRTVVSALAAEIGRGPVIYMGSTDEGHEIDGDIVVDRPVGRMALTRAWEALRPPAAA